MKKATLLPLFSFLLVACGAIQKDGANIKSLYFINVPNSPIKIAEFDQAGILLHVDYSNRASAEFPVTESWLPEEYLHYLGEPGRYSVSVYFRGKETKLNFEMAENEAAPKYNVSFLDYKGNALESYVISHRKDAHYEGETPEKEGYVFAGWDQSLYGVCRDMVYHPVFQIAE